MKRKAKSPYQKYNKTPYRYSEIYRRWRAAFLRGDYAEADALSDEHKATFGAQSHEH